jgi:hypothetical protein
MTDFDYKIPGEFYSRDSLRRGFERFELSAFRHCRRSYPVCHGGFTLNSVRGLYAGSGRGTVRSERTKGTVREP